MLLSAQEPPPELTSPHGFEAFQVRGEPPMNEVARAKELLQRLGGSPLKNQVLRRAPDVELQAFPLGSEYPELYSVWLKEGWIYPGSYQQAKRLGLTNQTLRLFVVPPRLQN